MNVKHKYYQINKSSWKHKLITNIIGKSDIRFYFPFFGLLSTGKNKKKIVLYNLESCYEFLLTLVRSYHCQLFLKMLFDIC